MVAGQILQIASTEHRLQKASMKIMPSVPLLGR
jgi:hypothetical protein